MFWPALATDHRQVAVDGPWWHLKIERIGALQQDGAGWGCRATAEWIARWQHIGRTESECGSEPAFRPPQGKDGEKRQAIFSRRKRTG